MMNSTELRKLLIERNAEQELVQWAEGKSLSQFWQQCGRGDWMLWLCDQMTEEADWPDRFQVLLAACKCADDAVFALEKKYPKNKMPRKMLEAARDWASSRITLDELRAAIADYRREIDIILKVGFLSSALHNAIVAVHDAASVATGTYPGAAAHAVQASIASTSLPGFLRSGRDKKFADLIRRELTVPHELQRPPSAVVSTFDSSGVLNTAVALHEQLGPWIQAIFAELARRGLDREHVTSQSLRLIAEMEEATSHLAPPLISLAMIMTLGGYIRSLTAQSGPQNGITPAAATTIALLLTSLEKDIDGLLREEGLLQSDTYAMLTALLTKLNTTQIDEHAPVPSILATALIVDNYVRHLAAAMAIG